MPSTVVITTKNRREDVLKAIASAACQTARPEVLVIDDGSTDGTPEAVAREFPQARLERSDRSLGYISQRNRGVRLASAPIIFSIDDDAVFSTSTVVEQTLQEFDQPRVGAVAIPFIEVNRSPKVMQQAPSPKGIFASYSFIGTAHALRRDLFLKLEGYREILFHQGEEEDYCIRMLAAGYITRVGRSDPIHHFESPRRSWTRMDFYGARNKVLYAWQNVPFPWVVGHLGGTSLQTMLRSFRPDRFWTRLRGVLSAYSLCITGAAARQPVSRPIYRLSCHLRRHEAIACREIEHLLCDPIPPCGMRTAGLGEAQRS